MVISSWFVRFYEPDSDRITLNVIPGIHEENEKKKQ